MQEVRLFGFRDAYQFLGISNAHFCRLIEKHQIPFVMIKRGRIFFEDDLEAFKKARKEKISPIFGDVNKRPKLFGQSGAVDFIGVSQPRFLVLLKNYNIPFQKTSCGRVFTEVNLKSFVESEKRQKMQKHGRN